MYVSIKFESTFVFNSF